MDPSVCIECRLNDYLIYSENVVGLGRGIRADDLDPKRVLACRQGIGPQRNRVCGLDLRIV